MTQLFLRWWQELQQLLKAAILPSSYDHNHTTTSALGHYNSYFAQGNATRAKMPLCHDLFQFGKWHEHAAFALPLFICCVMVLVFVSLLIWALISLVRVRMLSHRRKNWKFGISRSSFYALLIVYALGRTVFFLLRIIFGGYNEQMTMHDAVLNKDDGHVTYPLVFMIGYLIYHYASLCYYSAFTMLCIDWSQHLLYTYGLGIVIIKRTLRKSKIGIAIVNLVIHATEWIFLILSMVLCSVYQRASISKANVYSILSIIYLSWHCMIIIGFVSFMILWHFYARSKMWAGFDIISNFNYRETKRMKLAMTVVSIIITLKFVWSLALLILTSTDNSLCIDTYYVFVSIVDIVCDCFPVIIVVIYLTPSLKTRIQQIDEFSDYSESDSEHDNLIIFSRHMGSPPRVIDSRKRSDSFLSGRSSITSGGGGSIQQHPFSLIVDDQSRRINEEYFSYQSPPYSLNANGNSLNR